jgi:hypothetical protein
VGDLFFVRHIGRLDGVAFGRPTVRGCRRNIDRDARAALFREAPDNGAANASATTRHERHAVSQQLRHRVSSHRGQDFHRTRARPTLCGDYERAYGIGNRMTIDDGALG